MSKLQNLKFSLIVGAFLALIDQLTKYFAGKYLATPYIIIPDFFKLEYAQNPGIAFGIPIPPALILIANVLFIFLIIYFASKELNLNSKLAKFALALLLGGALGNLVDRFNTGYVIDFIAVWHWPNFNFADIYISLAVLMILGFYARIRRV
ncbi:MAG: signal peptidase II [Patescibacteria group bacterium]